MAIIFPGSPDVGDTYEAPNGIIYEFSDGAWRLSAENQGGVGVYMSTSPPPNPQNGDLWFHTGEADLKIFYIDPSSSQWIPASSPPDPYEENFVSISGDTMSGMLKFSEKNDDGGIKFLRDDKSTLSTLYRQSDSITRSNLLYGSKFALYCKNETNDRNATMFTAQWKPGDDEALLHLYHVADPESGRHAANKQYVDDAITALPVDDRIQGMPGTRYEYSDRYDDNLPDGCFHITGSGAVLMSRISYDGIEMSSFQTDDRSSNVRIMCHVRGSDGRVLHSMVSSHWYQGKGSNKRIELSVSSRIRDGKGEMSAGTVYYITDGVFNF